MMETIASNIGWLFISVTLLCATVIVSLMSFICVGSIIEELYVDEDE